MGVEWNDSTGTEVDRDTEKAVAFGGDPMLQPSTGSSVVDDALPTGGLLSFYDRLRGRMVRYCERRAGRFGKVVSETLLLVPDIFILLVRLSLDKDVPKEYRTLIASTLAYFILPFDLFPEGVIGPLGFMDDMMLASGVLGTAFGGALAPYADKHWSGARGLREVLGDVSETANAFLGDKTSARVQGVLARHGVVVQDAFRPAAEEREAEPMEETGQADRSEPFAPTGPIR